MQDEDEIVEVRSWLNIGDCLWRKYRPDHVIVEGLPKASA